MTRMTTRRHSVKPFSHLNGRGGRRKREEGPCSFGEPMKRSRWKGPSSPLLPHSCAEGPGGVITQRRCTLSRGGSWRIFLKETALGERERVSIERGTVCDADAKKSVSWWCASASTLFLQIYERFFLLIQRRVIFSRLSERNANLIPSYVHDLCQCDTINRESISDLKRFRDLSLCNMSGWIRLNVRSD